MCVILSLGTLITGTAFSIQISLLQLLRHEELFDNRHAVTEGRDKSLFRKYI